MRDETQDQGTRPFSDVDWMAGRGSTISTSVRGSMKSAQAEVSTAVFFMWAGDRRLHPPDLHDGRDS